jgi:tetratricopeptide (TPR) repeat protein
MSKQLKRQSVTPVVAPANTSYILVSGVICLAVGLAVGYFIGKQSVESQVTLQSEGQSQIPAENPSAFLQEELALKSILRSNPNDLNALIQIGNLYYDHGQFQEAVQHYGRALDIDPRNANVRTDRGTSYWRMGQPDNAISDFRKSLEIDPAHAQTLYNLGIVYRDGKNDREEARKAWERLLETNPNYPERASVEKQLASFRSAASSPEGNDKMPSSNIQDLMQRLKKQ